MLLLCLVQTSRHNFLLQFFYQLTCMGSISFKMFIRQSCELLHKAVRVAHLADCAKSSLGRQKLYRGHGTFEHLLLNLSFLGMVRNFSPHEFWVAFHLLLEFSLTKKICTVSYYFPLFHLPFLSKGCFGSLR